jgi:hypothetical protein
VIGFVEVVGESGEVVTAERFEANNVKWLQSMSTVRRKYSKKYTVGITIISKINCEMTTVAIKYKKTTVSLPQRFLLCLTL